MDNYIHKATYKDIKTIKSLMLIALKNDPFAFSIDFEELEDKNFCWFRNYLNPFLDKKDSVSSLFLYRKNSITLGMIGCLRNNSLRRIHSVSIVWFYVLREFRDLGVGKLLIQFILDHLFGFREIKKIQIFVNSTQKNAIHIYKSFGFEVSGELKNEFCVNNQFVNMLILERLI